MYCYYEKRLSIVAYMPRIFPIFSGTWTNSGCINDPDELLKAERRLFCLIQPESFSIEKKKELAEFVTIGNVSLLIAFPPPLDLIKYFVQPDVRKIQKVQLLTF